MKSVKKDLLRKEDIPGKLDVSNLDVLLTIGAGDIDTLVGPIEEKLKKERMSMRKIFKILLIYSCIIPYYNTGLSCQFHQIQNHAEEL